MTGEPGYDSTVALSLAWASEASGDRPGAWRLVRQMQHDAPEDWTGWWAGGVLALADGDAEEALEALSRAARLNEHRVEIAVNIGIAQWLTGHPRDARRSLAHAASVSTGHVRATACLGVAHLVAGLDVEAERTLSRAASAGGDSGVGSVGLGVMCARRKQWPEAERCFLAVAPADGARRAALANLAHLWRLRGMLDEASRCAREAARLEHWPEIPWEGWTLALAPVDRVVEEST